MKRSGFSVITILVSLAIGGFLVTALVSFMTSTTKANQALAQDVDVELFKSEVFLAFNSINFTKQIFKTSTDTLVPFDVAADGPLPTPISVGKIIALGDTYSIGSDLGSGITLSNISITSSYLQGPESIKGVPYNKFIVDLQFSFTRDVNRSQGSQPKPFSMTVPIWVDPILRTIQYAGFESSGTLAGDVLEDQFLDFTVGGTTGASCNASDLWTPPQQKRIDASSDYAFCGIRGIYIDPVTGSVNDSMEKRDYAVEKRADGFFWVRFSGHITTPPVFVDPTIAFAVGTCHQAPTNVRVYFSCVK